MKQTELAMQRLRSASSVPDVLSAAWDAFDLLRAGCAASADRSVDLYPAFTFARGAAVSGRNVIAFASSAPGGHAAPFEAPESQDSDVHEVAADAMAGLASVLSSRPRDAAGFAVRAGDRAACEEAAGHADQVSRLIARASSVCGCFRRFPGRRQ